MSVEINTLKVGDKFVLESYYEKCCGLYLIYEMDARGWAECVEMHSGKTFFFGSQVTVNPVEVAFKVKNAIIEIKPVDLTHKCGSCVHSTSENKEYFKHSSSYVRCVSPDRRFRDAISAYRPRTTKCCKCYEAKETENAT